MPQRRRPIPRPPGIVRSRPRAGARVYLTRSTPPAPPDDVGALAETAPPARPTSVPAALGVQGAPECSPSGPRQARPPRHLPRPLGDGRCVRGARGVAPPPLHARMEWAAGRAHESNASRPRSRASTRSRVTVHGRGPRPHRPSCSRQGQLSAGRPRWPTEVAVWEETLRDGSRASSAGPCGAVRRLRALHASQTSSAC